MSPHQALPASHEAETGMLCSILIEPKEAIPMCEEQIAPQMIHNPGHRILYEAILGLHAKGEGVDILTLTAALQEKRLLESVGGPAYLAQLQTIIPTWRNLKFYLEIIQSEYHKRQLLQANHALGDAVYGDQEELGEAVVGMEKAISGWKDSSAATEDITHETWLRALDDMEQKFEARTLGGFDKVLGIPTGLAKMDRLDGGMKMKTFSILAGGPNQGKTRLFLQCVGNAARQGVKTLFFSLESPAEEVVQSLLCQDKAVTTDGAFEGYLKESDLPKITTTVGAWKDLIFIDDTPGLTVAQIKARAKRFMIKHPDTKIIGIDHHLLISPAPHLKRNASSEESLADISKTLSAMRKELGVHLILLCQINRTGSLSGRATKDHIKGSGQFTADADVIWVLNMEENPEGGRFRKGTINKDKGRNTPVGHMEVKFDRQYLLFEEV
jgi:replicative DNA helicase